MQLHELIPPPNVVGAIFIFVTIVPEPSDG